MSDRARKRFGRAGGRDAAGPREPYGAGAGREDAAGRREPNGAGARRHDVAGRREPNGARARRQPGIDEGDLRRRLERVAVPGEGAAEQRAWAVVRSAAPAPRPGRVRRGAAVGLAAAAVVAGIAATPPGAAVGDWVRDRVAPPADRAAELPRASRLPTAGRLLLRDARGVAVVARDGTRARLGRHDGATWSPHGRFVAAWRGTRLAALTPSGDLRWEIHAPAPIRAARWSLGNGYRIAYVTTTGELRIVAGDGTGDRLLATAAAAPPAWRPDGDRALALVSARGRLEVRDVDTGALERARTPVPRGTRALSWSADGRLLAAAAPRAIRIYDLRDGSTRTVHARARERFTAAAYAPAGRTLARVTRAGGRSSVRAGAPGHGLRELFATRGRVARAVWSPDGDWLMLEMSEQLVAVRVAGPPRVLSFPGARLEGWAR